MTLADGEKAPDGYAALRELDGNQDGVIRQDDAVFGDLRVWVDSNSNAVSESGERRHGPSQMLPDFFQRNPADTEINGGNLVGLTSTYQTSDGATHAAADVWFEVDRASGNVSAATLESSKTDEAIAALGSVNAEPAETVAVASATDGGLIGQTDSLPQVPDIQSLELKSDLRSRVSGLAQAIESFGKGWRIEGMPCLFLPLVPS